jgi:predicted nucleic acid-binding protein
MDKAIIFDASTIINFSMNGLIEEVRGLKKIFKGKFIMTEDVKREAIDNPMKIRRFQLEALKTKQLLDEKIFEMPDSLEIKKQEIETKSQEFLDTVNSCFIGGGREIHLIDKGEASCLALSKILTDKGIKNILAIDERTTRMLAEKPENLKKLLEKKLHVRIRIEKEKLKLLTGFKIIRSIELAYIAYKRGIVKVKGENVLEALLYGLKFNGASVSDDEIREIKNL